MDFPDHPGQRSALPDARAAFDALAAAIDRRWSSTGYRRASFPDIAAEELVAHDIPGRVGPAAVAGWLLDASELPQQQDPDGVFGDPPVTVYWSERFIITLLYWRHGSTLIHNHPISGALQLLEGSSLHATYSFREGRELNEYVQLGTLSRHSLELFTTGSTQPIVSGESYIHALVHLQRPTVSILVRTFVDPWALPGYRYLAPCLRHDQHTAPALTNLQLRLMDTLGLLSEGNSEVLSRLLASADPEVPVYTCLRLSELGVPATHVDAALTQQRDRDPEFAAALLSAYDGLIRNRRFLRAQRLTGDPDHRFLLSLMGLSPAGGEVSALIRARCPGSDPDKLYAEWASGIATAFAKGPATRWADVVARAVLRGASLATTIEEAHSNDPRVSQADLSVIDELYRCLPKTPVLDELLTNGLPSAHQPALIASPLSE